MVTTQIPEHRKLTDEKIMAIMQRHDGFREEAEKTDINDEEFLQKLRKLIQGRLVVNAKEAAQVYQIRQEWEQAPAGKNGYRPKYSALSVRVQVRNQSLHPISAEEWEKYFHTPYTRAHCFWLEDVLCYKLGRWPAEKRLFQVKNLKRGRPRKHPLPEHGHEQKRPRGRPRKTQPVVIAALDAENSN